MTTARTLAVKRDALETTTLLEEALPELGAGDVLLAIDRVGLTTNNVTYALLGATAFRYWDFFPTKPGFGIVPVWGFATVAASKVEGVEVGSRVYGYFPMANYLIVRPTRINESGFTDASPHRADLPAAYNSYTMTSTDPIYSAANEDLEVLFRPLFWTSFLLADQIVDTDYYGAEQLVISSASSKTAYGTAAILSSQGRHVVGLTSANNADFTRGLGCYDLVLTYDDVDQLATAPSAYIDFSGSGDTLVSLRRHLGDHLVREVIVGVTHQQLAGPAALGGSRTSVFFAPDQLRKRNEDWGRAELAGRLASVWFDFVLLARDSVDVVVGTGFDALRDVWLEVLGGTSSPRAGHVLVLSQ